MAQIGLLLILLLLSQVRRTRIAISPVIRCGVTFISIYIVLPHFGKVAWVQICTMRVLRLVVYCLWLLNVWESIPLVKVVTRTSLIIFLIEEELDLGLLRICFRQLCLLFEHLLELFSWNDRAISSFPQFLLDIGIIDVVHAVFTAILAPHLLLHSSQILIG